MKSAKKLLQEFKEMPLNKQTIISTAVIAGGVLALSKYKEIKQGAKLIANKLTNDDGVKEFIRDVSNVISGCSNVVKNFLNTEDVTSEDNSEVINESN